MIQLIDVSKSFFQVNHEIQVLKKIHLTINKGDYLAITGVSGSGKSTLMNIIGCLDQASLGDYYFNDLNIRELDDNQLSETRNQLIGFVFQHFHLLPRLTALENVMLPLVYGGVSEKHRKVLASEALSQVGLEDRMAFLPTVLSGGQKQRVAIARALVTKAPLILADEPTGALDSKSSELIMAIFQELNQQGKTIVTITHEKEVANCAKRQILLKDGAIIEER
ncbi:ABC transporter ATP-binding protein [uncultured Vagococcus sp.]|uniref:ABC transporter ATP-binding protein n=1 Tax=uncultured Vagococcus sp. TaxID=189676 RepID=UPI0037DD458B